MMVGTRCRIHFLQYLPKKLTKWGVKIFVNSESSTGYVLTYYVYTSASGSGEKGSVHKTVMKLMSKYLNKNFTLYTDNFCTSPLLFKELLENKTCACGTVRQIGTKELKSTFLKRLQYRFPTSDQFTAGIWHDWRDVIFHSAIHSASVEIVQKQPKG